MALDPVELTAALVRCPSVTPLEAGALELLEKTLSEAGFSCVRVDRNGTPNLFARWGDKAAPRTLGFNGHTDVVPVGDEAAWTVDPFGGEIKEGKLWGRGATDMKSGVAAFVAAACDYTTRNRPDETAIIISITGDEEGDATDGTIALLDYMEEAGEKMSVCLVGEPTCPNTMGEMIKIGRRGSITGYFTAHGTQGHVAYPHQTLNPVPALAKLMSELSEHCLDQGTEHFDPSNLEVTTFDVGNAATNVVPATAQATVNIRFNDAHSGASLSDWMRAKAKAMSEKTGVAIDVSFQISGESFLTPPGRFVDLVAEAVAKSTGVTPELSTTGGTSDARFIKNHCPVVEFGLVGKTMHKVDEHVEVAHITALKDVYSSLIGDYFA
ncbi:succinyl-diaminopimelate desuccinylase [Celeribacter halophilus]|uniref:Succinyl-diaminopimelate desuccinylase n=1 Tax=Celeribacter halophilus TaxID=576117 RepID=A0AAW7XVD3_9RHOB|nr:succinyl-diaminopimelate desuccinylase [Celeribacter halophilus]MDO6456982.1 succinyl-diaminopimelate desuccinylase [Celeribacter halophilus]MDO6723644.1 succinyl-diaminopimelate desuccinylase [Celeribacter halophilus]